MSMITETRASLKAICPRKALFDAVQTVGHAVTGRNPMPILQHILLYAEGESLRLVATDLELGISCRVANRSVVVEDDGLAGGSRSTTRVLEAGGLTAPAKPLTEVLANLPDKDNVAISVDKSHTVRIHCEQSRSDYNILGLPAEEYPKLPTLTDTVGFEIPQARLREMIRQTLFAVSADEARAILTGVLLVFEEDTLRFVATDTHRLAVKEAVVTEGSGGPRRAIVPARAMNELARLLTDSEGAVKVLLSDNQIQFALPGDAEIQIISRLIEGQFPNFQRVIPAGYQKKLTVSVDALLRAVRRASIVARENAYRIVFRTDGDKLILTAESQMVGNAREEVEIEREGDDVEIAFNSKYLLDVLNVIDTDRLQLELTESLKPGLVRPVPTAQTEEEALERAAPDYLCVLMPMQIV